MTRPAEAGAERRPPLRNGADKGSQFQCRASSPDEWSAFDALPVELRTFLNNARVRILATTVVPHYREHGVVETLLALARLEECAIAELQFKDSAFLIQDAPDFRDELRRNAFRR